MTHPRYVLVQLVVVVFPGRSAPLFFTVAKAQYIMSTVLSLPSHQEPRTVHHIRLSSSLLNDLPPSLEEYSAPDNVTGRSNGVLRFETLKNGTRKSVLYDQAFSGGVELVTPLSSADCLLSLPEGQERSDNEIAQEIQEQLVRQAEQQRQQEENDEVMADVFLNETKQNPGNVFGHPTQQKTVSVPRTVGEVTAGQATASTAVNPRPAIARKLQEREMKEERKRQKQLEANADEEFYDEKGASEEELLQAASSGGSVVNEEGEGGRHCSACTSSLKATVPLALCISGPCALNLGFAVEPVGFEVKVQQVAGRACQNHAPRQPPPTPTLTPSATWTMEFGFNFRTWAAGSSGPSHLITVVLGRAEASYGFVREAPYSGHAPADRVTGSFTRADPVLPSCSMHLSLCYITVLPHRRTTNAVEAAGMTELARSACRPSDTVKALTAVRFAQTPCPAPPPPHTPRPPQTGHTSKEPPDLSRYPERGPPPSSPDRLPEQGYADCSQWNHSERYPSDSSKDGYPSHSSKDRYPSDSSRDRHPSDYSKERYPSDPSKDGYPSHSSKDRYPSDSSKDRYPSDSKKDRYPSDSNKDRYPSDSSKDRYPSDSSKYQYPSDFGKDRGRYPRYNPPEHTHGRYPEHHLVESSMGGKYPEHYPTDSRKAKYPEHYPLDSKGGEYPKHEPLDPWKGDSSKDLMKEAHGSQSLFPMEGQELRKEPEPPDPERVVRRKEWPNGQQKHTDWEREKGRDRQREMEKERKRGRDRQKEMEREWERERERGRDRPRETEMERERQREMERDREKERERERGRDRPRETEVERERDREKERERERGRDRPRETEMEREWERERQREMERDREKERERERGRDRPRETQMEREWERERDREKERERGRDRPRETEMERDIELQREGGRNDERERERDRHRERGKGRNANRDKSRDRFLDGDGGPEAHRHRNRDPSRERHKHRDYSLEGHRHRDRDHSRDRHRHRDGDDNRDRHRHRDGDDNRDRHRHRDGDDAVPGPSRVWSGEDWDEVSVRQRVHSGPDEVFEDPSPRTHRREEKRGPREPHSRAPRARSHPREPGMGGAPLATAAVAAGGVVLGEAQDIFILLLLFFLLLFLSSGICTHFCGLSSDTFVLDCMFVLPPTGRKVRGEFGMREATQGITRLDLREQELRDLEVARRLQEEELKASQRDKRAAQVAQDEEIARLLMEEEKKLLKKSREKPCAEKKRPEGDWKPAPEEVVRPRSREDYEHQRPRNHKPTRLD
ncbi:hypothetical protein JZ751_019118 [Albula glossodonta]|uniref:Coiled-coil domain-containing protein n=1 Tax=Albula glossodonta TaxID=121402 RepID=A0A8T2NVI3_9TELE|nr:hypothetical protein JZ751_019118 [Albula glossodonta]